MTTYKRLLLRTWMNHLLRNKSTCLQPYEIEHDGRKQKKALRELLSNGYLSLVGSDYHVNSKCWDEISPEDVDLIKIWEEDIKIWNSNKQLPLVRFNLLTWGQKKTVIMNAGVYQWHVMNAVPLQFDVSFKNDDISDVIVRLGDIVVAEQTMKDELRKQGNTGIFCETEIVLKSDQLTKHVKNVRFDYAYGKNLKWCLTELGLINGEEAGRISTGEDVSGTKYNLGVEPTKWADTLADGIRESKEKVVFYTQRLAVMEKIAKGVESMGGWEKFLKQYRSMLACIDLTLPNV